MTRRRVERLEDRAGVGRAAWAWEAATCEGAALEAVRLRGGDAGQGQAVRAAFLTFRGAYRPGAGLAGLERAADALFDELEAALDPDAFAWALALMVGTRHT